jgi:hypothetical protein
MQRTLVAVGLVVVGLVTYRAGVAACGDKSLGPGGIRWQRSEPWQRAQAQANPASILIYGQPSSRIATAARELKLQETLRRVGHTFREVATTDEFDAALAAGGFNIIMADVAEVPALQQRVASLPSPPAVVAVAYKMSKTEKEASKKQRFLVKVPSPPDQYLGTIGAAVRSKGETRPKV